MAGKDNKGKTPQLSIEDTAALRRRVARPPSHPYELFDGTKNRKAPSKKQTDLRKLSAAIKAQRPADPEKDEPKSAPEPVRKQFGLLRNALAAIAAAWQKVGGK